MLYTKTDVQWQIVLDGLFKYCINNVCMQKTELRLQV